MHTIYVYKYRYTYTLPVSVPVHIYVGTSEFTDNHAVEIAPVYIRFRHPLLCKPESLLF